MNTIIESLLTLHARYPGFFTVLAALIKATTVIAIAGSLVLMLGGRSARARCWVWRVALLMLALLAGWTARPDFLRQAGLNVTVVEQTVAGRDPTVLRTPESMNSDHAPAMSESPEQTGGAEVGAKPPEALQNARTRDLVFRGGGQAPPVELAAAPMATPKGPGWRALARRMDDHIAILWLAGFAALACWKFGRGVLARRWLSRHSQPCGGMIEAHCPQGMKCRMSLRINAPLITGLLRPVIWLPEQALSWSELKLRAAFQHEKAHHARHDLWWQALGTLGACAWWWLPLSWLALRKLKAEAEKAADDFTVTRSLSVADYAEALVQIARNAAPIPESLRVGIAMSGYSELEQRVRELLRDNPWRDRMGFLAGIAMTVMFACMSCVVLVGCNRQPAQYTSLAKLAAGGRISGNVASAPQYKDYMTDFYGTIVETLESGVMHRRAAERVQALNPDLKKTEVVVRVSQSKGSAIFNVSAVGSDPKYTRVFLDALLDEFRAFREQIREQQRNKALTTLAEDLVKREKALKEKSERLARFQKENTIVVLANGQNQAAEFLKQMTVEKSRLMLDLGDIGQAVGDVETWISVKRVDVSGAGSSDNHRDGASAVLTRAEQDYLNARSERIRAQVDLEVLRAAKSSDAARLAEVELSLARLDKLMAAYSRQVADMLKAQQAGLERRITILDGRMREFAQQAVDLGGKLAEYNRLEKDSADSEKAYHEMFDLVRKFQANEEMSGDYVAIMERASAAVQDVRPWWQF